MNYNTNHPEKQEDELYLGNFSQSGYHQIGWRTKRLGKIAYTIYGEKINPEESPEIERYHCLSDMHLCPAFVKKNEVQRKLDEERAKIQDYMTELSVSAYEGLLNQ